MESKVQVYSVAQAHPLSVRRKMSAVYLKWAKITESDVIREAALKRAEELLA